MNDLQPRGNSELSGIFGGLSKHEREVDRRARVEARKMAAAGALTELGMNLLDRLDAKRVTDARNEVHAELLLGLEIAFTARARDIISGFGQSYRV